MVNSNKFDSNNTKKKHILIVAFGDSVTMGCTKLGKNDFNSVYHSRLKSLIELKCPNQVCSIINSGIASERSIDAQKRLYSDVIDYKPDWVLIEFGLNDACEGIEKLNDFKNNLEIMVTNIKETTEANIVMITPNYMCMADNQNIANAHRKKGYQKLFSEMQLSGILKLYSNAIRQVATKHKLYLADVYASWEQLSANGINTDLLLCNGLNHPNPDAHMLTAELLFKCMKPRYKIKSIKNICVKYK
jgi:lysophospholipase L1-like esterase